MSEQEVSLEYLKKAREMVGANLRKKREYKGLSIDQLANKLGWKSKTISNIENGIYAANLDQISRINYFLK